MFSFCLLCPCLPVGRIQNILNYNVIFALTKKELNKLSHDVIGATIEAHKALGLGLLKSIYHDCLKHELSFKKIDFQSEMLIDLKHKGCPVSTGLRCDLFIENCLLIELNKTKLNCRKVK